MPGRNVIRNGLRKPWPTVRLAFADDAAASGLPADAAPVSGSMRISDPASPTGSPLVRMSCERSMPPSALRGWLAPSGSLQGFFGVTGLAVLGSVPPSWP